MPNKLAFLRQRRTWWIVVVVGAFLLAAFDLGPFSHGETRPTKAEPCAGETGDRLAYCNAIKDWSARVTSAHVTTVAQRNRQVYFAALDSAEFITPPKALESYHLGLVRVAKNSSAAEKLYDEAWAVKDYVPRLNWAPAQFGQVVIDAQKVRDTASAVFATWEVDFALYGLPR